MDQKMTIYYAKIKIFKTQVDNLKFRIAVNACALNLIARIHIDEPGPHICIQFDSFITPGTTSY